MGLPGNESIRPSIGIQTDAFITEDVGGKIGHHGGRPVAVALGGPEPCDLVDGNE